MRLLDNPAYPSLIDSLKDVFICYKLYKVETTREEFINKKMDRYRQVFNMNEDDVNTMIADINRVFDVEFK